MSEEDGRIDLAHVPGFALGRLTIRPATRELVRDDGATEILEPRVMQVLVALHRAAGAIVTRDELTRWCWEGRVVGEDAINRVLSRLRRSAEGIGEGSFRIETITKVGYRLVALGVVPGPTAAPPAPRVTRRWMIAAGAAGVATAGAAATFWPRHHVDAAAPPEVADLMQAGWTNGAQATADGDTQARGLFRRVTELAPGYAGGWAALAAIYANETHYYPETALADLTTRARAAIARAHAIEPDNSDARLAEVLLLPLNHWIEIQRALRALTERDPKNGFAQESLGRSLASVGRVAEAAQAVAQALAASEAAPVHFFDLMTWQWAAGQLDEADRTIAHGMALFPRNFTVWFGSFYVRLFTGRIDEAIAMAENVDGRPQTIPDSEIDAVLAVARVMRSRDPAGIAEQRRVQLERAHLASGYAEVAMQTLGALGLADDVMTIAEAYFLNRGWTVPPIRFPRGQGSYTRLADRRTWFLFYPMMAPLWRTPRFARLTEALGLERYWKETGATPDYRRQPAA